MYVLILDGGNDFLSLIGDVLKLSGHMPLRADSLKDAREILENDEVKMVIAGTDAGDGLRFHSYVREFSDSSEIPFLFVAEESAHADIIPSSRDFLMSCSDGAMYVLDVIELAECMV